MKMVIFDSCVDSSTMSELSNSVSLSDESGLCSHYPLRAFLSEQGVLQSLIADVFVHSKGRYVISYNVNNVSIEEKLISLEYPEQLRIVVNPMLKNTAA